MSREAWIQARIHWDAVGRIVCICLVNRLVMLRLACYGAAFIVPENCNVITPKSPECHLREPCPVEVGELGEAT